MMTGVEDRVFAIRIMAPHFVSEKLELRRCGPVDNFAGVPRVCTKDFLQKHEIHIGFAQQLTNLVQDEAAISSRKSLMDIVSEKA